MTSQTIARLSVTLQDVEPKVTRRLEVPADIRLDRLHLVLQAAMGWTNAHLYEIRAGDVGWGIPDPDWPDGPLNAKKATLWDVVEGSKHASNGAKTLHYTYDFGDNWEHVVRIERFTDPDPAASYPVLIAASGRCPPEDIGGFPGYEEFLAAIADPDQERHEEINEWRPADFDPTTAPVDDLKSRVAALARQWNRKPRARKSA